MVAESATGPLVHGAQDRSLNGFMNARHTAYDWFGSHECQRYFREAEILEIFRSNGIHDTSVIELQKCFYKIRKGLGASVDDEVHAFGAQT